ncbi:MAG: HAD family hydrolase [Anaerolineae bacterium]|nr:HAD family hydrolase [Anaerolineae bacterium]MDW8098609.1 HAD family hydrolase [Anaerolineae bacterium]
MNASQHAGIQAVFFDFGDTLTTLQCSWQEVMTEGAVRMAQWLRVQGLSLPADFAEQWLAARRFAAQKARQEQEEHTADDTLAFLLQFHGHGKLGRDLIQQAVDVFFAPEREQRVLLPGARETLATLHERGYRLGVISNATSDHLIQGEIDRLGLRPYLALVLTSAAVTWRKPRPEIFQLALARLDVLGYEAVMVGDSLEMDVKGAQDAQMWAIWADIVPNPENDPWRGSVVPDAIIHELPEVVPIIEKWSAEWGWSYATGEEDFDFEA